MKHWITALTLTAFSLSGNAQITVTANDMPNAGNIFYMNQIADFALIDPSTTGPNQTWDFSGVVGTILDTINTVSVSSTPAAYQFFFNNQLLYPDWYANYAVVGQGFDVGGFVTIADRFDYFKSDTEGHKIVGFGANINGAPASVRYDNIDFIYDFPLQYQNRDTSFADFIQTIPTLGTYGADIRREKEVDGWGTVITPNGTYQCLRVKTTLDQTDTVYVDQFMFGNSFARPTEVIYDWVANNEGVPVFSVTERNGTITNAEYKDDAGPNSIAEKLIEIKVYPNPAQDEVNILSSEGGVIRIFDLTGKIVFEQTSNGSSSINIADFDAGIYQLHYYSQSGAIGTKKFEVLK